jgi:tetratricopeptide (TPR) repeat protein
MRTEPKLVGRDAEIEAIMGYFGEALKGKGSLILISGEAGIGKTRVLNTVTPMAKRSGFQVMIGNCIPGISNPYLPFHEAFAPFSNGPFVISPMTNAPMDPGKRAFMVLDFLKENGPVLLCIEDLHWADSMSIQLIHFLARNARGIQLAILGTYRPEDVLPREGESEVALMDTLQAMRREGVVQEVKLERIGEGPLTEAIRSMIGAPMTKALAHRIAIESGGNPLFALELVKMLVTSDAIVLKDGIWELSSDSPIKIPSTVQEVIVRRLEKLPLDQRHVIEFASVMGGHFDSTTISAVMRKEKTHVLEALESLDARYRLIRSIDMLYSFEHEKIREVTYNLISAARRKEIHRIIGVEIEGRLPNDWLLSPLSYHFHMAGELKKSANYSLRAGEFAFNNSGGSEAAIFYERALSDIANGENDNSLKMNALLGLGDCYSDIEHFSSAERVFTQGLSIASESSRRGHFLWRLANCYIPYELGKGRTSKARIYIEMAEGLEALEDFDLAMTYNVKALIEQFDDMLADANLSYQRAEEVLVRLNRMDRLGEIYDYHAGLLLALGKIDEAYRIEELAQAAFNEIKSPYWTMYSRICQAQFCIAQGKEDEARGLLDNAQELCMKLGYSRWYNFAQGQRSLIFEMQMDYEMGRFQILKSIEAEDNAKEDVHRQIRFYSILSRIDAMTGKDEEAFASLDHAERLTNLLQWNMRTTSRGMFLLAKAMCAGLLGKNEVCLNVGKDAISILEGGTTNAGELPICRQTFGIFLLGIGLKEQGLTELRAAKEIFLSYGNLKSVERIDRLLP